MWSSDCGSQISDFFCVTWWEWAGVVVEGTGPPSMHFLSEQESRETEGSRRPTWCPITWPLLRSLVYMPKRRHFPAGNPDCRVLRVKDPQSLHHGPLESGVIHTVLCLGKGGVCPGHVPGPILGFLLIASLKLVKLGFRRLSGSQESDVPV